MTGSSALIDLAYASANLGGEYGNGKLRTATRHNRIGVTDNQVVETYTYGGVGGRVSQRATTVEGRSITQGFTWNELGQPATVTYPDDGAIPDPARTVSYTTSYGFLTAVPDYTAVPTGITYSVNMMPSQLSFPNGVSVSLGLDPANIQRVASIATSGASTNWSTGTYGFDGAGNIKSLTRSPSDLDTYVYDKVSRLTSASFKEQLSGTTKTQTAGYDAFGFMTSLNTNGSNQTFAPVSGTNRISGVSYDTAGDMTSWSSNPSFNYTWDPLGKMQTLTGTGFNHTFLYTAEGERIADRDSLVKHATTIAIRGLDGTLLRLFVESGTSGTGAASWLEDVVWGNGMLLATVSADPDAGTRFYANDHLGTPRLVTSACATTVAQHTYYPFGTEASATCQDSERTKYTGQERDLQDTCAQTDDLDSMHARVYNPNIARFLSADALRGDPHSPQSFNLFAYVSGNPMRYVDRWGLDKGTPTTQIPCPDSSPPGSICFGYAGPDPTSYNPYSTIIHWIVFGDRGGLGGAGRGSGNSGVLGIFPNLATARREAAAGNELAMAGFGMRLPPMDATSDIVNIAVLVMTVGTSAPIGMTLEEVGWKQGQRSLLALIKEAMAENGGYLTREEAETVLEWGEQEGFDKVLNHIDATHWTTIDGEVIPHIGIGPWSHIPVKP